MITLWIGSAVVGILVTVSTGGNWQAGLVVAGVVFCSIVGGIRRRRAELEMEARRQATLDLVDSLYYVPEPRRRWFR